MGRNKIPTDKIKKRLDVYIETKNHNIIIENKLLPEIIETINKLIKEWKTKQN